MKPEIEAQLYDAMVAAQLVAPDADVELAERRLRWAAFGAVLQMARDASGFSKRQAAARADFSEGLWRQFEAGGRLVYGQHVPPNPRPDKLIAACVAVEISPLLAETILREGLPIHGSTATEARRLLKRSRDLLGALRDQCLEQAMSLIPPGDSSWLELSDRFARWDGEIAGTIEALEDAPREAADEHLRTPAGQLFDMSDSEILVQIEALAAEMRRRHGLPPQSGTDA